MTNVDDDIVLNAVFHRPGQRVNGFVLPAVEEVEGEAMAAIN